MHNLQNRKNAPDERKNTSLRFSFWRNHFVQWLSVLMITLNLASWGALFWFIPATDAPVLLRYNAYFGFEIGSLGPWYKIFVIPGIGLLFIVVHVIFGYVFYLQKERMLTHLLFLAGVLVQIAVIIATVSIIFVNQS